MRALRILAVITAFARPVIVGAQVPVPPAPVPRVDSARVDTLRGAAADSTGRVVMPRPAIPADTGRKSNLFGPGSDLRLDVRSRIEARADKRTDERCTNGQIVTAAENCSSALAPTFNPQFMLRSAGTIGGRVHVDVDYDESREFDASNVLNVYYEGKASDRLQRLEVGNVSFALPSTRFLSSGIPTGNYGLQATGHIGPLRLNAIAAQQKGNVAQERTYFIGDRVLQSGEHELNDNQVEPRRFFFTVDPALFKGAYPNIDILNRNQLASLAASLPDTLRPRRIVLYRVLFGAQPQNPNGPRFRINGDPGRGRQTFDVLREGVDYYLDPSQLWFALVSPLRQNNERLVVAYTVRINGRDTVHVSTGGTPDLQATSGDQIANLVSDPNVLPGTPEFRREIRSVYRIGGDELIRGSTTLRVVSGAGEQEKPAAGTYATFLQMFGLAQSTNPARFDLENRMWPRPTDPNFSAAAGGTASMLSAASVAGSAVGSGSSSGRIIRDHFVIFPSLQPFAKRDSGLVVPGNPTNEAIYTSPSEYLYSSQHPANVYRLKVHYETEAGADAGAIALGSVQVRRGSERVVIDGRPLIRDVDYRVDYELGRLTFARPETLFTRQRAVSVHFEENALSAIAATPTSLFGFASTLPLPNGELNFMAVRQSQSTNFTRPALGFEPLSSLLAGVNGQLSWDVAAVSRAVNKLPFVNAKAPSRLSVQGEFATSHPQPGGATQAYVESFESESGVTVSLFDQNWSLSSQPADGHALPLRFGPFPFDTRRATTIAFQNFGTSLAGIPVSVRGDSIDPNATLSGVGNSLAPTEQLLWLTLYPLAVGGRYDAASRSYAWTVADAPAGRRYRSVKTVLNPAGIDLSRAENLEFWTLIDTATVHRSANPTLVFDLGDVSENTLAFSPDTLLLRSGVKPDSIFHGKRFQGFDRADTERDPISRAFNAAVNDTGLPGDVVDTLVVGENNVYSRIFNFPLCNGTSRVVPRLGDTRANCTVHNNRLDEEDIDLDGVLNLPNAVRNSERLSRFVVDLGDARRWVRFGKSFQQQLDSTHAARTLQWVLIRVPFRAADDTINDVLLRRIRALRVTMISGPGIGDDEFIQVPLARLKLTGPPWLKRNAQTLFGIAGETPAFGYTQTSLIGTADKNLLGTDDYQSPPGIVNADEQRNPQIAAGTVQINERSLRLQAGNLPLFGRAEAYYRFPNGQQSFMGYRQLRLWARGRRVGWGQAGELQMYVKMGRDANNFYMYRTPVSAGSGQAAWNPEVLVDFNRFFALRQKLQNAYLQNRGDTLSCSGVDVSLVNASMAPAGQQRYVACDGPYMVYTVEPGAAPPNLAAVQEMAVGFVRLPPGNGVPSVVGPADSLELWVDDIRLDKALSLPGYASQVSVALSASDFADVHVGLIKRDANFRQLAEQPTFSDDRVVDIVGTLHLEKLLPPAAGLAVPLTITHVSASSTPLFLSGTDVPGAGVQSLRTPSTGSTTYALSVRRIAPLGNPLVSALVDNLGLTSTYTTGDTRNEYQSGANHNFALSLDYNLAAEARTAHLPGVFGIPLRLLPFGSSAPDTANTPTTVRWNPTVIRFSSGVVRGSEQMLSYFKPAVATDDSGRVARSDQNLWRNATTLEFRPAEGLSARWDFVSLRDLRDYGDTTAAARTATEDRAKLFGANVGLERERSLLTSVSYAPQLSQWFRPRADFGTQYGMLRDPNVGSFAGLTFGNTVTETLPRRITVSQNMGGGVTIDVGKALTIYGADSSLARRLARVFAPLDINVNRSLLSAFDAANTQAPLGLQFGLGGVDAFRQANGQLAATTGLSQSLSASQSLFFPGDIAFVNRYRRTTTRSWTRRADDAQSVADGEQTVFPDVSVRWNWKPPAMLLPVLTSFGANVGFARSAASSFLPGDENGLRPELRGSVARTLPFSASIAWGFGHGLTTSGGYTRTTRTDSLPGSLADGTSEDLSVDVGRSFKFPKNLGFTIDNDVRTRISWQRTHTSTYVSEYGIGTSRLADNGRSAVSLNADTDLSDTVIFTLQGSRVQTFDRNFNRSATQFVLSTVFQVRFFGDTK
ncbi:MAG: cell surface protein SprA [bacterium]